jgi:hypothetical protein
LNGEDDAAIAEYRAAAELTKSLPEQRYLTTQAARLNAGRDPEALDATPILDLKPGLDFDPDAG